MTIVQCRRRAADAKWLALSVSANTPELRAEREARYIRMRLSYSFLLILFHYMQHAQNIYSSINHCLFPVWFHNHKRSVQELQEGWDEGWDEGFNGRGQLIKVEKIAFSGMSDMYFN